MTGVAHVITFIDKCAGKHEHVAGVSFFEDLGRT